MDLEAPSQRNPPQGGTSEGGGGGDPSPPAASPGGSRSDFFPGIWEACRKKSTAHWVLLILSSASMLIAFPASSLLSRLYYSGGGGSYWIISWTAVAGWPITTLLLVPLYAATSTAAPSPLTFKLFLWYAALGIISALDNLLFALAYAYLPASTASLLASSSLIFSAFFGWIIVKNKVNLSGLNAIIIITAAVVIIALDSRSDGLPGVSRGLYALGFIFDILGSALHGLIFALSELVFVKELGRRSFHVVLEFQTMVSLTAFIVTTIGVVAKGDFQRMREEAASFEHGQLSYTMVLVWAAVSFQLGVLGGTAVVYLASTVMAGILNAVRVPLTSIAAVILFKDSMTGFKILSLIITGWGFVSYTLGHPSVGKTE